jgi:hypothetical protein
VHGGVVNDFIADPNGACSWLVQPGNDTQERCLANTRWPEHNTDFASSNTETDPFQDLALT